MSDITSKALLKRVNNEIAHLNSYVNEVYMVNYPDRTREDARIDFLLHRIAHLDMKIEQLVIDNELRKLEK